MDGVSRKSLLWSALAKLTRLYCVISGVCLGLLAFLYVFTAVSTRNSPMVACNPRVAMAIATYRLSNESKGGVTLKGASESGRGQAFELAALEMDEYRAANGSLDEQTLISCLGQPDLEREEGDIKELVYFFGRPSGNKSCILVTTRSGIVLEIVQNDTSANDFSKHRSVTGNVPARGLVPKQDDSESGGKDQGDGGAGEAQGKPGGPDAPR